MINTDLLPDAPVCSKLVMGYKAFTATNTAIWIFIVAGTFLFMLTVAADGELAITGTNAFASLISIQSPSIVSSPNFTTLVRRREGTTTVVTGGDLLPFAACKREIQGLVMFLISKYLRILMTSANMDFQTPLRI